VIEWARQEELRIVIASLRRVIASLREGVRERRSERRVAHTPPSGTREGRGRRVACREGRRLYIHVYKYMFIQPVRRLQGGEAPIHPCIKVYVYTAGGSPAGKGGTYISMYISICLYSRRVACREGRRLYIHVYKYIFIQPVGRLQGGEAPAGRTAATPVRRAPAGGGDRAVRGREHGYDSDMTRMGL
jgi:hypothetical protein